MHNTNYLISRYNHEEAPLRLALVFSPLSNREITQKGEKSMNERIRCFTLNLFEKLLLEKKFPVFKNPLLKRLSHEAQLLSKIDLKSHNGDLTDPETLLALCRYRYLEGKYHHVILMGRRIVGSPNPEAELIAFTFLLGQGEFEKAFTYLKYVDTFESLKMFKMLLTTLLNQGEEAKAIEWYFKGAAYGLTITGFLELYLKTLENGDKFLASGVPSFISIIKDRSSESDPQDLNEGLLETVKTLFQKRCFEEANRVAEMIEEDFCFLQAVALLNTHSSNEFDWKKRAHDPALNLLEDPVDLADSLWENLDEGSERQDTFELMKFLTQVVPDESRGTLDYAFCEVIRRLAKQKDPFSENVFPLVFRPLSMVNAAGLIHTIYKENPGKLTTRKLTEWELVIRSILISLPQDSEKLSDMMFYDIFHSEFWEGVLSLPKVLYVFGTEKERLFCDLALAKTLKRLLDKNDWEPAEEFVKLFSRALWSVWACKKLSDYFHKIPGEERKSIEWFVRQIYHQKFRNGLILPVASKLPPTRPAREPTDEELFRKPPSR